MDSLFINDKRFVAYSFPATLLAIPTCTASRSVREEKAIYFMFASAFWEVAVLRSLAERRRRVMIDMRYRWIIKLLRTIKRLTRGDVELRRFALRKTSGSRNWDQAATISLNNKKFWLVTVFPQSRKYEVKNVGNLEENILSREYCAKDFHNTNWCLSKQWFWISVLNANRYALQWLLRKTLIATK